MSEKKTVSAKAVLADIRDGATNDFLMQKYGLSDKGLQSLFKKLLDIKAITNLELDQRMSRLEPPIPPQKDKTSQPAETTKDVLHDFGKRFNIPAEDLERLRKASMREVKEFFDKHKIPLSEGKELIKALGLKVGDVVSEKVGKLKEMAQGMMSKSEPPVAAPVAEPVSTDQSKSSLDPETIREFVKAAENGDIEDLKRFLSIGIDVNAQDPAGRTALTAAAFNRQVQSVRFLLQHGADRNIKDRQGRSPLEMAQASGSKEVETVLAEKFVGNKRNVIIASLVLGFAWSFGSAILLGVARARFGRFIIFWAIVSLIGYYAGQKLIPRYGSRKVTILCVVAILLPIFIFSSDPGSKVSGKVETQSNKVNDKNPTIEITLSSSDSLDYAASEVAKKVWDTARWYCPDAETLLVNVKMSSWGLQDKYGNSISRDLPMGHINFDKGEITEIRKYQTGVKYAYDNQIVYMTLLRNMENSHLLRK